MTTLRINDPEDFTTYPNNQVCAIIDTAEYAQKTFSSLLDQGFKEDDIHIFSHAEGIKIFDAEAEKHGLFAKIAKKLRAFGDMENDLMKTYETSMEKGAYIFEVGVESDEKKKAVDQVFIKNEGHDINYFGSWVVESMEGA